MQGWKLSYLATAILLSIIVSAFPAKAGALQISYNLNGVGKVVSSTPTTLTLIAQANGSVLSGDPGLNAAWNPISYSDQSVLNLTTNLLDGNFTLTFADADTLTGTVFEDDTAIDTSPTQTGAFPQILTFIGGTGEFAGATGSVSGNGFLGTTNFTVSGSGTLNTAAVPEPASGAFLLAGVALLTLGRRRTKSRLEANPERWSNTRSE